MKDPGECALARPRYVQRLRFHIVEPLPRDLDLVAIDANDEMRLGEFAADPPRQPRSALELGFIKNERRVAVDHVLFGADRILTRVGFL